MSRGCGADRPAGSGPGRWRCAIGWAVYLVVAIVVVVFAGMAAGQPTAAPYGATHCASRHGAERLGGTGPALLPENLERLRRPAAGDTIAEGRAATQMPALDADSRAVPLPLTADPPVTAELPRTRVARCEAEAGSQTR